MQPKTMTSRLRNPLCTVELGNSHVEKGGLEIIKFLAKMEPWILEKTNENNETIIGYNAIKIASEHDHDLILDGKSLILLLNILIWI